MDLFGIEEDADSIEWFELILIPGLLQIEAYARSVISIGRAAKDPQRIDQLVEIRMKRQQILARPDPPKIWMIISEAALRQIIGGMTIMRAQWQHLLDITELSNVTLQVLPFTAGPFLGMSAAFLTLSLGQPDGLQVVVVENLVGTSYLESESEIRLHTEAFNHLRASALTESESRALIQRLLSEP
jgi:hypothetical protein